MPIESVETIWMDGKLVPWADARVHVLTHAFQYGTGVFEGIRCYPTDRGPAVFRLEDHVRRLYRSAAIYRLTILFEPEEIVRGIKDTIRANDLSACYVRPVAFRGYGEMGVNLGPEPASVTIVAWPWGSYLGEDSLEAGVRVMVSSWRRNDANAVPPAAKATGQYLNSALAKAEAIEAGFDEAVLLNPQGFVADGSGQNVFVVREGVVMTPPESAGILLGITRESVIELAREQGHEVRERNLVRSDLYTADEVFLCGTAAEVVPVRDIDGRPIADGQRGPVTKAIQSEFFAAARGELDRHATWNDPVET